MMPSPENFPQSSSQPEKSEFQPEPRHTIHIEKQPTKETEQRKQWLENIFQNHHGAWVGPENARVEYAHILDQWGQDIPGQAQEIASLRNFSEFEKSGKSLPTPKFLARVLHNEKDPTKLRNHQELGKAVINRYNGQAENKQWQNLSEQQKRYVRLGEMTILIGDMVSASRVAQTQKIGPDRIAKLTKIADDYAQSADVPRYFGELLDNLKSNISGEMPTLHNVWGTPPENSSSQPPQTTVETTYVENSGEASQSKPPDNVIETEFNPATGTYEPSSEKYTNPRSNPEGSKGNSSAAAPTSSPSIPTPPAPPSAPPA